MAVGIYRFHRHNNWQLAVYRRSGTKGKSGVYKAPLRCSPLTFGMIICPHRLPSVQPFYLYPRLSQAVSTVKRNRALFITFVLTVAIPGVHSMPVFSPTQGFRFQAKRELHDIRKSIHVNAPVHSAGMGLGSPLQYPVHTNCPHWVRGYCYSGCKIAACYVECMQEEGCYYLFLPVVCGVSH